MSESWVSYRANGKIGIITLNRPAKLNAINGAMKEQLVDAFGKAGADKDTSVVVLRAEGRSFCVGYDIDPPDRHTRRDDPLFWEPRLRACFDCTFAAWTISKPVVASVQGHVLGGGCELAMLADLTIAADNAQFGEPEVRFSHLGPLMIMPWIIGLKRARELLYMGDLIDAQTALQYGMINKVVPLAELEEKTMNYANRMALIAPEALRSAKLSINRGAEMAGLRAAMESNVDMFIALYASKTEVGTQFDELVRDKDLKAALQWRAEQFRNMPL
jgi:enoyl-CoA hydratase/carnithine racemase